MTQYTPMPTITGGEIGTPAWANQVRDNFSALAENRPRCMLRGGSNISIANNFIQAITFDTETSDPQTLHSMSSNTSRITVPTGWDGIWGVTANVEFAAATTGYRQLQIMANGTGNPIAGTRDLAPNASFASVLHCSKFWPFTAGDWMEVFCYQNSGGALNVLADHYFSPEFTAVWICP